LLASGQPISKHSALPLPIRNSAGLSLIFLAMALRDVTNSIPTEAQLSDVAMDVAEISQEQYFHVIKARKLLHGLSTQQA
jgi:hypothetical protein